VAGCVVARRLADGGRPTLLLEAGAGAPTEAISTIDALEALDEPGWVWPNVTAEHGAGAHRFTRPYRQGRGIGGGSAVNSMVLAPGDRADYDSWDHQSGCRGWTWSAMAPWFARVEAMLRPETAEPGPFASAFGATAGNAGHPVGGTSRTVDATGYLGADLAKAGEYRRSAASAYLAPTPTPSAPADGSRSASALTVQADSTVARVLVEGVSAVGVELADGSTVMADRVVVAAGALATPRLLWRTGIHDPSIGRTVSDHPSFVFSVALRPEARLPESIPAPPVTALLRWSSGLGPRPGGNDLSAHVLDHVGGGLDGRRRGAVIVALTDVRSRGSLHLDEPEARFSSGSLSDPDDRVRLLAGVRHIGALLTGSGLRPVVEAVALDERGTPATELESMSDEAAERWLVGHPGPVSHAAATLPLGVDGPIDCGGAVRGYDGLYVIDASVLPCLPTGNPQLAVMAVAERLSSELLR
jgi:choline dehydrogenase-like flavoprotein